MSLILNTQMQRIIRGDVDKDRILATMSMPCLESEGMLFKTLMFNVPSRNPGNGMLVRFATDFKVFLIFLIVLIKVLTRI